MVSILYNRMASIAHSNMLEASEQSTKFATQISSGQRIVSAKDDVAAFVVGTLLQNSILTLKSALSNSSQAQSMLEVAESGLKDISDILQRMKTLSSTATSGTLDTDTRTFVDSEFSELFEQIDNIAQNTKFNDKHLLSGSIFAPTTIKTQTQTSGSGAATQASATLKIAGVLGSQNSGVLINGVTFMGRRSADINEGHSDLNYDVANTITQQRDKIISGYNAIIGYTGTNQGLIDAQNKLREVTLAASGTDSIVITSRTAGTIGNDIRIGGVGANDATDLTLNGENVGNDTAPLSSTAVNGALHGGQNENLTASATINITGAVSGSNVNNFVFSDGSSNNITLTTTTSTTSYNALSANNKWLRFATDSSGHNTTTEQAHAIANKLNALKFYSGTDSGLQADAEIARKFDFIASDSQIKIIAKEHGTNANDATIAITGSSGSNTLQGNIDGESISSTATTLTKPERGTYITASMLETGKQHGFKSSGTIKMNSTVAANDTISINGAQFTFVTTSPANDRQVNISGVSTTSGQMLALKQAINNVLNYTGSDATTLAAKENLENLTIDAPVNEYMRITSKDSGAQGNEIKISVTTATANEFSINGENFGVAATATTVDLATIMRGTYVHERASTFTKGVIKDSILEELNTVGTESSTGIDVSKISNNPDFIGKLGTEGTLTGTYAGAANRVNLNFNIGEQDYVASNVNTNVSNNTEVTFTSSDKGSFKIVLAGGEGISVSNADDTTTFIRRISDAIDQIEVFQKRELTSYVASGNIIPTGSTLVTGNLSDTSFDLETSKFKNTKVENVTIEAPKTGSSNANFRIDIDGDIYSHTTFGKEINANSTLILTNQNNPNKRLYFNNGNTKLELDTDSKAIAATKAFRSAFGLEEGNSQITFQVGEDSDDLIEFGVEGVKAKDIFLDSDGAYQSISLSTAANATTAGSVVDRAITKVVGIRAKVGGLLSKFNFLSSHLQTNIQNQEAAKSSLLDTDVTLVSSEFSKAQIRLKGSISMLVQANQMHQSLLKLL